MSQVVAEHVVRPNRSRLGRSVLDLIGNTPLLAFARITQTVAPVQILAKAEWHNPGGSVKDRAAMAMILDGERSGALRRDKTIIDATSGNTGIAYAMIAAERGYKLRLALPANASRERKQCLKAYGVDLILTDPAEGTDGAQRVVKKLVAENPDAYFYPDQYNNDANWRAHYETTAREIWRQTDGRVTHFVAGLGTCGTFTGVSRGLKELSGGRAGGGRASGGVTCISMQPDSPLHGMEGLKHLPTALVPGIYDPTLADEQIEIATEEAQRTVVRLAREEGLLVGVSSGGNMAAALRIAAKLKSAGRDDAVVVTVFSDSAAKYLSEDFWNEPHDAADSAAASEAENWP